MRASCIWTSWLGLLPQDRLVPGITETFGMRLEWGVLSLLPPPTRSDPGCCLERGWTVTSVAESHKKTFVFRPRVYSVCAPEGCEMKQPFLTRLKTLAVINGATRITLLMLLFCFFGTWGTVKLTAPLGTECCYLKLPEVESTWVWLLWHNFMPYTHYRSPL